MSTSKQFGKFRIPEHWVDVTSQRAGRMIGIVGPVSKASSTTSNPNPESRLGHLKVDNSQVTKVEEAMPTPVETDEELLASILENHPGLTRETALEYLRTLGFDLQLPDTSPVPNSESDSKS